MAGGSLEMDDRSVLLKFYSATNGSSWRNKYGWNTDLSLKNWHGVTVNGAGRIIELELTDNGLEGSIPDSLGQLLELTYLNLKSNRLSGPIPESLGKLSNLTKFNLYNNKLGGRIPESLGDLSNLEDLNLRSNQLTGAIPKSLGQLSHIVYLKLDSNKLSGTIPTSFGQLSNLKDLNLRNNQLNGTIPEFLGRLSDLVCLKLDSNKFSGAIPKSLGQLSDLTQLMLGNNMLNGTIPRSLEQVLKLDFLNLTGNQLSGPIPKSLGRKFNLTVQNPRGNRPTGSPEMGSSDDRSVLLDLFWATNGPSWHKITGWNMDSSISTWHGVEVNEAGRVIELELISNGLEGAIPESLGKLSYLTYLNLWGNQLIGAIPESLGQLSNLRYLNFEKNILSGTIPESLGKLSNLTHLTLWSNRLIDRIPESLGRLSKLKLLNLRENELNGAIPEALGQLTNLVYLYLYGNKLSGAIPKSLGQLINLTYLSLGRNQLVSMSKAAATALKPLNTRGRLSLGDNPWGNPPAEVVSRGLDSVVAYWEALARSGASVSWKMKVVLVGAVKAGKTSLVRGMMKGTPQLCDEDDRTKGVDVHVGEPCKPDAAESLELMFWDFAGHSEYYSTHQIFLSKGALHLLVVDLKRFTEEPSKRCELIEVWLDALQCRIPGSHVLVIATQIDRFTDDHEEELASLKREVETFLSGRRSELEKARNSHSDSASSNVPSSLFFHGVEAVSSNRRESLLELRSKLSALIYRERNVFSSVGKRLPLSWVRVSAMLEAKRSGDDIIRASRLRSERNHGDLETIATGVGHNFLHRTVAIDEWSQVVRTLKLGKEVGLTIWDRVARALNQQSWSSEKAVFENAVEQLIHEGSILDSGGVLYLEPTWINKLLRAILDHDLDNESKQESWKNELETFSNTFSKSTVVFRDLMEIHNNFPSTGILTVRYLRFLWRDVPGIGDEKLLKSLLNIMSCHGVVFQDSHSRVDRRQAENALDDSAGLFVPLHLPSEILESDLEEFALLLKRQFGYELVYEMRHQTYIPSGVLGLLMARFLCEDVRFRKCWGRGATFTLGAIPVLIHLDKPTISDKTARITANVFGKKFTDELEKAVSTVEGVIKSLFQDRFSGIYFYKKKGSPRIIESEDAVIERIDGLKAHFNRELSDVVKAVRQLELNVKDSTETCRAILARVNRLRSDELPFPSLVIVRPAAAVVSGKRSLKAMVEGLGRRAKKLMCKDLRLCFLCPLDFSEVPCGLDGNGYPLSQRHEWVKVIYPALKVTAVLAKVAVKAASGWDLPVSDFVNGVKSHLAEELTDNVLNDGEVEQALEGIALEGEVSTLVGEAYGKLKIFMDDVQKDKRRKGRYVHFDKLMQQVDIGEGGKVWVSNENVQKWKTTRS